MAAYATPAELAAMGGLPAGVLAQFSGAQQADALVTASGVADDYLQSQYEPPLSVAPIGLKLRVCRIAVYLLMSTKGFDPERGSDKVIADNNTEALEWLEKVSRGAVVLFGVVDQTPALDEGMPVVVSRQPRGW